jgi:hypothetical protein
MAVGRRPWRSKRALLILAVAAALATATALAASAVFAGGGTTSAQGPCDIYAAAGTPCVAAHSTTRALYAAYNGPLYQVKRASDGATTNIGTLRAR